MKELDGIHHISAITGDATKNLEFYVGVMGLRLVKKTVNQDDPTVYHLFYADEQGSPGADLTFFEYPGAGRGRAGAGMIHRIGFRVGSEAALEFWARRLASAGLESTIEGDRLRFEDPEGLGLELIAAPTQDRPLVASHPEIDEKFALQGFAGVRAFERTRYASNAFLTETMGFNRTEPDSYESRRPPPRIPASLGRQPVRLRHWLCPRPPQRLERVVHRDAAPPEVPQRKPVARGLGA